MENRMKIIFDAASQLFINKGYSKTQMKDIAKKIGLSPGMLYIYFSGKKDILCFILKCTINPSFIENEFDFPIHPELFDGLENEIVEVFEKNAGEFFSHLNDIENYPIEQMLYDAFDVISKYGICYLLIEKNPEDLAKLASYYNAHRKKFYDQVFLYISQYIKLGTFRQVEYPQYVTRVIIETLSWWGMHVMNDVYEIENDITIEIAKSVCMDNLLHAYKR